MGKQYKSGYFRLNRGALQSLSGMKRAEIIVGYLILSRFTNGAPPPGFAPHSVSCAGVNAMKTYGQLSEATGKGVINTLLEAGLITIATDEQKNAFRGTRFRPTYELQGNIPDLDLPNSLVDGLKSVETASPLKRIKNVELFHPRQTTLRDIAKADLWLDTLMTLLAAYAHTSMKTQGGLSVNTISRIWHTQSKRLKPEGYFEWMSEPDIDALDTAYLWFMRECLPHLSDEWGPNDELADIHKHRFWNAWENIKDKGLVYEAVAMFNADPTSHTGTHLICTLRVNDFHADKGRGKTASWRLGSNTNDPSLLTEMIGKASKALHFYNHPDMPYDVYEQGRQDGESLRLSWPSDKGHIVGVWRPRFRAISSDTGAWLDIEKLEISNVVEQLLSGT